MVDVVLYKYVVCVREPGISFAWYVYAIVNFQRGGLFVYPFLGNSENTLDFDFSLP